MELTKLDKTVWHKPYEPWVDYVQRAITAFSGYPRFTEPGVLWLSGPDYKMFSTLKDYRDNSVPGYRNVFDPVIFNGPNSIWGIYVAKHLSLPKGTALLTAKLTDAKHYFQGGDESKYLVVMLGNDDANS